MATKSDKWVKRWEVAGSNGKSWTVAIDVEGNYACSCPVWKFRREECHHITLIKNGGGGEVLPSARPEAIPAAVLEPMLKDGQLLYPLVPFGPAGLHMEVTIVAFMLANGYSIKEIKARRHLPASWTLRRIWAYIEEHGNAKYPDNYYDFRG